MVTNRRTYSFESILIRPTRSSGRTEGALEEEGRAGKHTITGGAIRAQTC